MTPEFAKDFIAFQKSLKPLKRNATGDDGTPYADFASIVAYVRPKLAKHGFAFMQAEGGHDVEIRLLHVSGVTAMLHNTPVREDGELRYGRRHSLMCALGLVEEPLPDLRAVADSIHPDWALPLLRLSEDDAIRVVAAFNRNGLSVAQRTVVARKTISAEDMIAEAQRLGGQK